VRAHAARKRALRMMVVMARVVLFIGGSTFRWDW
jgi:hypothetical protein